MSILGCGYAWLFCWFVSNCGLILLLTNYEEHVTTNNWSLFFSTFTLPSPPWTLSLSPPRPTRPQTRPQPSPHTTLEPLALPPIAAEEAACLPQVSAKVKVQSCTDCLSYLLRSHKQCLSVYVDIVTRIIFGTGWYFGPPVQIAT